MALQIAILGTLEPRVAGVVVVVPPGKQRALLTLLALRAPQRVAAESAAEVLWPRAAPAEALRSLQVTVSRLRRSLGTASSALETVASGYRLAVETDTIDARRFETLVDEARAARVGGDGKAARRLLDDALGLWRGPALADVGYESFAQSEIGRLEELRLGAIEERIDVRLSMGEHALVVAELEQLSADYPSRERLVGLLMLALYRCDRQADALAVYQQGRRRLDEELGLEPSATLRRLERAILTQSAELAAPVSPGAPGQLRLSVPPNRTIARERELAALGERLRTRSVRLVTLTGPGGVGKTRLALEAARAVEADFPDGAHFVSLAALQRPKDVAAEIVKTLRMLVLSGESPELAVERFLAAKQLLLVIDNFEHLLPSAAPFIGDLLGGCPALTVLATSREPLALQAEERYPVQGLAGADAVELFCERARAHDPGFDAADDNPTAVAEICRRVDGLPLAIELAAARCALLPPGEIAERLEAALRAPGAGARDAPPRQRTLRATIDWSYALLSEREKACFARFAAFAGGATVEAAEAITGVDLDTLDHLVAKSLLVRRQSARSRTRLGMLETIRSYAAERFAAAADQESVRERHYGYYLTLAQRHGTERALWGSDSNKHLAVLDAEIDNLEAALRWAIQQPDAGAALAMSAGLGRYWLMRDRYAEAVEWIDHALSMPGAAAHPELRVRALCSKVWCLWPIGRGDDAAAVAAEAETTARAVGDPVILTRVLQTRAELESVPGRLDVANALADEALAWASAAGDKFEIACATCAQAIAASTTTARRERVDRAAALLDDVGSIWLLADLLGSSAYVALREGSDDDAREFVDRAMPLAHELENGYIWILLLGAYGLATLLTGNADAARQAFRQELTLCRELVVLPMAPEGLLGLAAVAVVQGDLHRAARLMGAATAHNYGRPADAVDARLHAAFLEPARTHQNQAAWEADVREGQAMSFDAAIACALDEPRI